MESEADNRVIIEVLKAQVWDLQLALSHIFQSPTYNQARYGLVCKFCDRIWKNGKIGHKEWCAVLSIGSLLADHESETIPDFVSEARPNCLAVKLAYLRSVRNGKPDIPVADVEYPELPEITTLGRRRWGPPKDATSTETLDVARVTATI